MVRAVHIDRYGSAPNALRVVDDAQPPRPGPGEVLVRVVAASINPIDCWRRRGYGRGLFEPLGAAVFPIVPGRDCAGVVEAVGPGARRFKPGDAVWSAPDPFRDGTHAEYVAICEDEVEPKPPDLSFEEAAALPYAALTAWQALVVQGGLDADTAPGRRVLVHAGAGGIGSFSIQLLKAWGAWVATTCSTRNLDLVTGLGADRAIDYTRQDFDRALSDMDLVLDTLGGAVQRRSLGVLKRHADAKLVTLVSPALPLTDRFGLAGGAAAAVAALTAARVSTRLRGGRQFRWAFFRADGDALAAIGRLVEAGRIRPVIDRVYPLDEVVAAHRHSEGRHARGKIVLRVAAP